MIWRVSPKEPAPHSCLFYSEKNGRYEGLQSFSLPGMQGSLWCLHSFTAAFVINLKSLHPTDANLVEAGPDLDLTFRVFTGATLRWDWKLYQTADIVRIGLTGSRLECLLIYTAVVKPLELINQNQVVRLLLTVTLNYLCLRKWRFTQKCGMWYS